VIEQGSDDPIKNQDQGAGGQIEPERWRKQRRFAILDPAGTDRDAPEDQKVYPTVYVQDELIIDQNRMNADVRSQLAQLAGDAGWTFNENGQLEDPIPTDIPDSPIPRIPGESNSVRIRLGIDADKGLVAATPDAWQLLRQARLNGIADGVSLNHVMSTDSLSVNPFKMNPFKMNPFKMNPFKVNAAAVGMDSYAEIGFGGMQPVTYLGPAPALDPEAVRRPVVAIFDTGWGRHPWLPPGSVVIPPYLPGPEPRQPIGISPDSPTNPERYPSLAEPFEGIFDDAAGHGTFIAGVVLQNCGDARILPVRIADGEGVVLENDLIGALGRLLLLMRTPDLLTEMGIDRIDVLNLSFSYYHETPGDPSSISEIAQLLDDIRSEGCVITCSAGNDATDRPAFPAAMTTVDAATGETVQPPLQVSVGALNPSDRSVAMFSNIGSWVKVYAPGVSIVSILPTTFNGGIQAGTRDDSHGHRRETLDADDFRGGFGVWSGTSFAAPYVAGLIAWHIAHGLDPEDATTTTLEELIARDHSRR
jgi:subtilisin family serine protease